MDDIATSPADRARRRAGAVPCDRRFGRDRRARIGCRPPPSSSSLPPSWQTSLRSLWQHAFLPGSPAGHHGRSDRDPVRRRHAHRPGAGSESAAVRSSSLGVFGTFATAALLAGVGALRSSASTGRLAGLVGAALAPTDPAVTFSVLRQPRDPRPLGHDPRGRVRVQRPGRDRADDRDDRVRDRGGRLVLGRDRGVRDRDGGRRSGRRGGSGCHCCRSSAG